MDNDEDEEDVDEMSRSEDDELFMVEEAYYK